VVCVAFACAALATAAPANGNTFSNTIAIPIADGTGASPPYTHGKGSPYPSNITVSGLAGTVSKVTVTLHGVTHTNPDDLDILLAGPHGQPIEILSDSGESTAISNMTLTFDDAAPTYAPDTTALQTGSYKPTNNFGGLGEPVDGHDVFPTPAPGPPYAATLAAAAGGTDPNGTWTLYATDDRPTGTGTISGGWSIDVTTGTSPPPPPPPPPPPVATTDPASPVYYSSATVHGTVDPRGTPATDCHFELGTTTAYGKAAPCEEPVGGSSGPVAVHSWFGGLSPSTTYHFKVVATTAAGISSGEDRTFTTPFACPIDPHGLTVGQTLRVGPFGFPAQFQLTTLGSNCWIPLGTDPSAGGSWTAYGPVAVNGFILDPVDCAGIVVDQSGMISADPTNDSCDTHYEVRIPNADGTITTIGRVDLAAHPFVPGAQLGLGTEWGHFGASPFGPKFGSTGISGGDIYIPFHSEGKAYLVAHLPLPSVFSTTPGGGSPPTADIPFSTGGGGGSGGSDGTALADCSQAPSLCGGGGCGCNTYHPPSCAANHVCPPPGRFTRLGTRVHHSGPKAHGADTLPGEFLGHLPDVPVKEMWLGWARLTEVTLTHNDRTGGWDGKGAYTVLPPDLLKMEADFSLDDQGRLTSLHGGLQWNPGLPLWASPPVTLNGFDFGIAVVPTVLKGGINLQVADIVGLNGHVLVAFATQDHPYYYANQLQDELGTPVNYPSPIGATAIGIGADVTLDVPHFKEIKLGGGYALVITESPGPYIEVGAKASLLPSDYGLPKFVDDLISAQASLTGQIGHDPATGKGAVNFDATLEAKLLGATIGAEGLVSSKGVAMCLDASGPPLFAGHIGFGFAWDGSHTAIFPPWLGGCGVGDWAATVAQTGGPRTVHFRPGLPFAGLKVVGQGAVPAVTVSGPNGQTFSPPQSPGVGRNGDFTFLRSTATQTIYVGIKNPGSGPWKVAADPGSAPVASVFTAEALPAARIAARVSGSGRARTLVYRVRARRGQTVVFSERGRGANQIIGTARGQSGALHFTPQGGPAGKRAIVAAVTVNGIPDGKPVVAHFIALPPPKPGRLRGLRVTRHAASAGIRWLAARDAASYAVDIALSDGRRLAYSSRGSRHSVNVANVARGLGITVGVRGIGPDNTPGPRALVRLAGAKGPSRVRAITAKRTKSGVVVSWTPVAGAVRYLARITLSGTTTETFVVVSKRARLAPSKTLLALKRPLAAAIVIRAIGATGQAGPPGRARYAGTR
jgi:hypothetical protein